MYIISLNFSGVTVLYSRCFRLPIPRSYTELQRLISRKLGTPYDFWLGYMLKKNSFWGGFDYDFRSPYDSRLRMPDDAWAKTRNDLAAPKYKKDTNYRCSRYVGKFSFVVEAPCYQKFKTVLVCEKDAKYICS